MWSYLRDARSRGESSGHMLTAYLLQMKYPLNLHLRITVREQQVDFSFRFLHYVWVGGYYCASPTKGQRPTWGEVHGLSRTHCSSRAGASGFSSAWAERVRHQSLSVLTSLGTLAALACGPRFTNQPTPCSPSPSWGEGSCQRILLQFPCLIREEGSYPTINQPPGVPLSLKGTLLKISAKLMISHFQRDRPWR